MTFEEYIKSLDTCEKDTSNAEHGVAYLKDGTYRFREIIKSISATSSPIKVLDIGPTPFTLFIKRSHTHFTVFALDIATSMAVGCKAEGIQLKICDLGKQSIPFEDGYFDLVIFTEVVEHLFASPTEVLKEIRRIMRVGGKLIISTPNFARLINRVNLLLGISPLQSQDGAFKRRPLHGYKHITAYTMKEIIYILKACDFIILKKKFIQPSVTGAFSKLKERGLFALIRGFYYLIGLLIPPFRTTIYIECYKAKPDR